MGRDGLAAGEKPLFGVGGEDEDADAGRERGVGCVDFPGACATGLTIDRPAEAGDATRESGNWGPLAAKRTGC